MALYENHGSDGNLVFESIACRAPMEGLYHRVNFRKEEELTA
jgi:hypothetical protein